MGAFAHPAPGWPFFSRYRAVALWQSSCLPRRRDLAPCPRDLRSGRRRRSPRLADPRPDSRDCVRERTHQAAIGRAGGADGPPLRPDPNREDSDRPDTRSANSESAPLSHGVFDPDRWVQPRIDNSRRFAFRTSALGVRMAAMSAFRGINSLWPSVPSACFADGWLRFASRQSRAKNGRVLS